MAPETEKNLEFSESGSAKKNVQRLKSSLVKLLRLTSNCTIKKCQKEIEFGCLKLLDMDQRFYSVTSHFYFNGILVSNEVHKTGLAVLTTIKVAPTRSQLSGQSRHSKNPPIKDVGKCTKTRRISISLL
jgi:hypothetical protein